MTLDADLLVGLRQPDQTSCGPSCLVAARMLTDPAYAHSVRQLGWDAEVLATHRRVTGLVAADGGLQPPWPAALGTPPWALARELSAYAGPHDVALARLDPARHLPDLHRAVAAGRPVPVYVGDTWLARHVVLALGQDGGQEGAGLRVYDPARGVVVTLTDAAFTHARMQLSGWSRAWFVVLPSAR